MTISTTFFKTVDMVKGFLGLPTEKSVLEEEKILINRLLFDMPTDQQLLDWAKEYHPLVQLLKEAQKRYVKIDNELSKLVNK